MLKTTIIAAALTSGLTTGLAGIAMAQSPVELGSLTCTSEGGIGMIITSEKALTCTFDPVAGEVGRETYSGVIRKFGLDIGETGDTVMEWTVLAIDGSQYEANGLAGGYGGVGADASFAVGLGANLLVGGTGESFVLQPISVQVQEGVNLAIGVETLTLEPVAG